MNQSEERKLEFTRLSTSYINTVNGKKSLLECMNNPKYDMGCNATAEARKQSLIREFGINIKE